MPALPSYRMTIRSGVWIIRRGCGWMWNCIRPIGRQCAAAGETSAKISMRRDAMCDGFIGRILCRLGGFDEVRSHIRHDSLGIAGGALGAEDRARAGPGV